MMRSELQNLTEQVIAFRDARNWKQFHNGKDLALALAIEAGELGEAFLWKTAGEADRKKVAEELADVFIYGLILAHEQGLDVRQIVLDKLRDNEIKYPVERSRDSAKKYDQLM